MCFHVSTLWRLFKDVEIVDEMACVCVDRL